MKRFLLLVILSIISLLVFFNIVMCINISNNKRVLNIIEDIFYKGNVDVSSSYEYEYKEMMTVLEIDDVDYVGVIKILDRDYEILIKDRCDNSFLGFNSDCLYDVVGNSLIVIGTAFRDSFRNYDMYEVGDILVFMNMIGDNYHYKISSIDRVKQFDEVFEYDGDMILVVKNYFNMEYVLFVCNRN